MRLSFNNYPAASKSAKECEIALKRFQGHMFNNRTLHLQMVPLRLLKPVEVYAHATILAHFIGLPLTALQSGRLGMSWRAPGRCLSTPGCQLPTGLTYASRCFCHHANIRMVEGDSAWNRRHKQVHFNEKWYTRGIN